MPSETVTTTAAPAGAAEALAPQLVNDILKLASDRGRAWAAAQRRARERQQRWVECLAAAQRLGATREQLGEVVAAVVEATGVSIDQLPPEARTHLP